MSLLIGAGIARFDPRESLTPIGRATKKALINERTAGAVVAGGIAAPFIMKSNYPTTTKMFALAASMGLGAFAAPHAVKGVKAIRSNKKIKIKEQVPGSTVYEL